MNFLKGVAAWIYSGTTAFIHTSVHSSVHGGGLTVVGWAKARSTCDCYSATELKQAGAGLVDGSRGGGCRCMIAIVPRVAPLSSRR